MRIFKAFYALLILVAGILLAAPSAHALGPPYYLTIVSDINFGVFAVRDNLAQHQIVLAPDDTATYSPEMISGVDAQRGEYYLEEWPINTVLAINVTDGVLSSGGGPSFTITDFTHSDSTTSPTGTLTLYLGATLKTSGSGARYTTGTYNGTVDLTISF